MQRSIHDDPDHRLVSAIREGDGAAFERLVEKYYGKLFHLVRRIVGDWQQSEDVCQEVFVSAFVKIGDFEARSRLSTWLYRIAVNRALKVRGKIASGREVVDLDSMTGGAPPDADAHAPTIESEEVLEKLLRPLPEQLRAVVLLKEREGLSYKEIAGVLGCSVGAVEQRLHRAFVALRDIWKGRPEEFGLER